MIEASFERGMQRSTAASGAYQYDTGQRLSMHGLPSPEELADRDEFLSGEMVTVQVHFGLKGDSQTQARLARWDMESGCWTAAVPDEYLQTAESVYAYVYVSYGLDEAGNGRAKTMYELVFKPISRPAPNNVVTGEQWEAWAVKRTEVDLAIDALQTAQGNAMQMQQRAETAAQEAERTAKSAQQAREEALNQRKRFDEIGIEWRGMKVKTVSLEPGKAATANLQSGILTLGLPRGAAGERGAAGDTGPADIALLMTEGVLSIEPRE